MPLGENLQWGSGEGGLERIIDIGHWGGVGEGGWGGQRLEEGVRGLAEQQVSRICPCVVWL